MSGMQFGSFSPLIISYQPIYLDKKNLLYMVKQHIVARIKDDLRGIWGDVADHLVDKRLNDLGLRQEPSLDEVAMVIELLDTQTFPFFLSPEDGVRKTRMYSKWLKEERCQVAK